MPETYKIMHGVERVERDKLFSLSYNTRTRSPSMKLIDGRLKIYKERWSFT